MTLLTTLCRFVAQNEECPAGGRERCAGAESCLFVAVVGVAAALGTLVMGQREADRPQECAPRCACAEAGES